MKPTTSYLNPKPARAVPPGATIRAELRVRGIDQATFAKIIERPPQFVSELLNGKRELTVNTARRLEAALGISADFWLRREAQFRLNQTAVDSDLVDRIRKHAAAF